MHAMATRHLDVLYEPCEDYLFHHNAGYQLQNAALLIGTVCQGYGTAKVDHNYVTHRKACFHLVCCMVAARATFAGHPKLVAHKGV